MPSLPPQERFYAKVCVNEDTECHEWTACRNSKGYGSFYFNGRVLGAHRVVWEWEHNDELLDSDDEIDHLCKKTSCVNPDHLRRVSRGFNGRQGNRTATRRKLANTNCPKGHAYDDEDNTYRRADGSRDCRACKRERSRKYRLDSVRGEQIRKYAREWAREYRRKRLKDPEYREQIRKYQRQWMREYRRRAA